MTNSDRISGFWPYKAYRIAVIAVIALLLTLGPFGKLIISGQMNVCEYCMSSICCCNPTAGHAPAEIAKKCSCEISEAQNIPNFPVGINHQQVNRIDIPTGTMAFKTLYVVQHSVLIHNNPEYSISLKAPPLYLVNSSFII